MRKILLSAAMVTVASMMLTASSAQACTNPSKDADKPNVSECTGPTQCPPTPCKGKDTCPPAPSTPGTNNPGGPTSGGENPGGGFGENPGTGNNTGGGGTTGGSGSGGGSGDGTGGGTGGGSGTGSGGGFEEIPGGGGTSGGGTSGGGTTGGSGSGGGGTGSGGTTGGSGSGGGGDQGGSTSSPGGVFNEIPGGGGSQSGSGGTTGGSGSGSGGDQGGSSSSNPDGSGGAVLRSNAIFLTWTPGRDVDSDPNNRIFFDHRGHMIATRVVIRDTSSNKIVADQIVEQYDYDNARRSGKYPALTTYSANLAPGSYEARVQSVFLRHGEVKFGLSGRWQDEDTARRPNIQGEAVRFIVNPPAAVGASGSGDAEAGLNALDASGGCSAAVSTLPGLALLGLGALLRRRRSRR